MRRLVPHQLILLNLIMREQNKLERILPLGLVATRAYILAQGIERHRFDNAVKSGKLKAVSRGVYIREGLPITWQGVMSSLARLNPENPAYVGGVSAIQLSGFGHYVQDLTVVHVYSNSPKPSWIDGLDLSVKFKWHGCKRLWRDLDVDVLQVQQWRDDVSVYFQASVEQACLELLSGVPHSVSFEYADMLFQGLTSMSPKRLDGMLKRCNSIKAKRLFFWYAQRHNFQWSKKLKSSDYDLGSGKRVIAEQGRLDNELMITVPSSW